MSLLLACMPADEPQRSLELADGLVATASAELQCRTMPLCPRRAALPCGQLAQHESAQSESRLDALPGGAKPGLLRAGAAPRAFGSVFVAGRASAHDRSWVDALSAQPSCPLQRRRRRMRRRKGWGDGGGEEEEEGVVVVVEEEERNPQRRCGV